MTTASAHETNRLAGWGGRSNTADEPGWLSTLRQAAASRFAELGLPTTRNEDWKFTSVAALGQTAWRPAEAGPPVTAALLEPHRLGLSQVHEVVFVNGRFAPHLSSLGTLPAGVTVASLSEAIGTAPELIEPHLGKVASFESQAFTALNTALMEDGIFISVPPTVKVAAPIHLLFISTSSGSPVAAHPRNLIVAAQSAEVTVVESYAGVDDDAVYFINAVTEVVVGPNARVEYLKLERESENAFHIGTIEARQDRDSRFQSFSFALGGSLVRTNIYSVMAGEGADCTMHGLYLLHRSQHIDHQTRIEHASPNCTSREVYKGILDGSSHAVFNGKVYVRPEAQKTDGKQTNKNLLLSEHAKVDTKPQLEIFADDVKCTHGATVGSLDPIALFYLESRGIGATAARRLVTYGFAADVLGEINYDGLRRQLERLVYDRLETAMQ